MVRRETGNKNNELLKICIRRLKFDAFWAGYPFTIYGSFIHSKKNLPSRKKLGIDPKSVLPLLGPFPTKKDVCGYGVAINIVSNQLNAGWYGGYTQYYCIRKLWTSHDNVYG